MVGIIFAANCGVLANQFVDDFLFQWISSLTSLCCSEPVGWRVCASANQFTEELVVQRISLLTSLCCRESVRWWIYVSTNQFRWRVCVNSFADELHVTSELVLLLNFAPLGKQFHCRFSVADSHVRNDVNAYNDLIV